MSFPATEARHPGGGGPSLRRRLLWLILASIAAVSLLQAATAYRTALRNADALFDAQLQQLAASIDAGVPLLPGGAGLYEFSIQVWGPGGVRIYQSRSGEVPTARVVGFSDATLDGVRYRIYLLRSGERAIQVAQDLDARRARARGMALRATLPILLLAPVLMLAVWWLIARSLAPVERMRRELGGRRADDLSPLPEAGMPREVLPLVRELNLLFRRVDTAFASQRHFVSDAAHELRSPLTALKLQAQALRGAQGEAQVASAVDRIEAGVDRAIQLLGQLLALARAEAESQSERPLPHQVDLQELCRAAVSDVLPQASAREVDVGVQTPEADASVRGDFEGLRILLRNLLENAVKFSPQGGQVDISILRQGQAVAIRVEDNGPGIPAEQRQRVFDRFHRGEGADAPGSGLGLAIVQAIARRHGAEVRLERSERLGGLRAEVVFSAA